MSMSPSDDEEKGLWNEGGTLDVLDKKISKPLFKLNPGALVEILWTIPGMWFGVPQFAGSVVPVLLGLYSDPALRDELMAHVAIPIVGFNLLYWALGVWESFNQVQAASDAIFSRGATRFYTIFAPPRKLANFLSGIGVFVGMPHLCVHLLHRQGSEPATHAGLLFCTAWCLAVSVCEVLKFNFARQRPCFCLADELKPVPRSLKDIQEMLRKGNAYASFPSGDSAGSGAFAGVAILLATEQLHCTSFVAIAFIGALGRVFLHAHHILDIVVGSLIGYGAVAALAVCEAYAGPIGSKALSCTQCVAIAIFITASKMKKKKTDKKHETSKDK